MAVKTQPQKNWVSGKSQMILKGVTRSPLRVLRIPWFPFGVAQGRPWCSNGSLGAHRDSLGVLGVTRHSLGESWEWQGLPWGSNGSLGSLGWGARESLTVLAHRSSNTKQERKQKLGKLLQLELHSSFPAIH